VVVGDLRGEPPTTKASLPGGQAARPKRASGKFREYSCGVLAHLVSEARRSSPHAVHSLCKDCVFPPNVLRPVKEITVTLLAAVEGGLELVVVTVGDELGAEGGAEGVEVPRLQVRLVGIVPLDVARIGERSGDASDLAVGGDILLSEEGLGEADEFRIDFGGDLACREGRESSPLLDGGCGDSWHFSGLLRGGRLTFGFFVRIIGYRAAKEVG
jgi:hypothetical protein